MRVEVAVRSMASIPLALALLAVSCLQSGATSGPATSYVLPGGSGDCSARAPCGSLQRALQTVSAGGTIQLGTGNYPTQVIKDTGGRAASFATNVVVEPAPGAKPVLAAIVDYAPHITFSHLRVDSTSSGLCGCAGVNITSKAPHSRLVDSRLVNATLYLSAADVAGIGNEIGPSQNFDGIDVGNGANGVVISGNFIHDLTVGVTNPNNVHVDCLQIYDSSNLMVSSNWFDNCTNRDLIFSSGQRWGVTNVVVENNFMRGCVTSPCQGSGYVVDARTAPGVWNLTNLSFVSNTVVDGLTLIGANNPGLVFRNNIIGALGNCINVSDHNLIASYNQGLCKDPTFLGSTNRVGALPNFANRAAGDLHLVQGDPSLRFAVQSAQPATDIDGFPRCQPSYVGAHDFCAHAVAPVQQPSPSGQKPSPSGQKPSPSGQKETPLAPGSPAATAPLSRSGLLWPLLGILIAVTIAIVVAFRIWQGRWPWAKKEVGEGSDITR
jgi:hypothetical protein